MIAKEHNMAAHTPTPWQINPDDNLSFDAAGVPVGSGFDDAAGPANVAFIVNAVNAHDDLLGALAELVALNDIMRDAHPRFYQDTLAIANINVRAAAAIDAARAALATATAL